MASNPSTRWYWNDWENDQGLRLCSWAAQGVWMRLLSIAARSVPIGYVSLNGTALSDAELAKLIGGEVDEICHLIQELEKHHVFSRDRQRRIYSRRMVRDEKARVSGVKHGRKGGNPALMQHTDIPTENIKGLTPADIPPPCPPIPLPLPLPKKDKKESSPNGELKKATRWPPDKCVEPAWIAEASSIRQQFALPGIDPELEAAKFVDHWTASSRANGAKLDWHAAWRNWIRNAHANGANGNGQYPTAFERAQERHRTTMQRLYDYATEDDGPAGKP